MRPEGGVPILADDFLLRSTELVLYLERRERGSGELHSGLFSPLVRPVRPLFTISEMPLVNRTRDGLWRSWGVGSGPHVTAVTWFRPVRPGPAPLSGTGKSSVLKGLGPPVPAAGLPAHTQALAEAGGAGPQAREWEGLGARRPPTPPSSQSARGQYMSTVGPLLGFTCTVCQQGETCLGAGQLSSAHYGAASTARRLNSNLQSGPGDFARTTKAGCEGDLPNQGPGVVTM